MGSVLTPTLLSAVYGSTWPSMAVHGSKWQYMVVHGSKWQYMAVSGSTWQHMAVHTLFVFLVTISAWQRRPSRLHCASRRPQRKKSYFPQKILSNYVASIETGDTRKWLCPSLFANTTLLLQYLYSYTHRSLSFKRVNFFSCRFLVWLLKSCTNFLMPANSAVSRVSLQMYLTRSVSQNMFQVNIYCCIVSMILVVRL
jgi:hypothetical protein